MTPKIGQRILIKAVTGGSLGHDVIGKVVSVGDAVRLDVGSGRTFLVKAAAIARRNDVSTKTVAPKLRLVLKSKRRVGWLKKMEDGVRKKHPEYTNAQIDRIVGHYEDRDRTQRGLTKATHRLLLSQTKAGLIRKKVPVHTKRGVLYAYRLTRPEEAKRQRSEKELLEYLPEGSILYWQSVPFKKLPSEKWVPWNIAYSRQATEEQVQDYKAHPSKARSRGVGKDLKNRPDKTPPKTADVPPKMEPKPVKVPPEEIPDPKTAGPAHPERPDANGGEDKGLSPEQLLEKYAALKEWMARTTDPQRLYERSFIVLGTGQKMGEGSIGALTGISPETETRITNDFDYAFKIWKAAHPDRALTPPPQEFLKQYPKYKASFARADFESAGGLRSFVRRIWKRYHKELLRAGSEKDRYMYASSTATSLKYSSDPVFMSKGYMGECYRIATEEKRGKASEVLGQHKELQPFVLSGKKLTDKDGEILSKAVREFSGLVESLGGLASQHKLRLNVRSLGANSADGIYKREGTKKWIDVDVKYSSVLAHEFTHFLDHTENWTVGREFSRHSEIDKILEDNRTEHRWEVVGNMTEHSAVHADRISGYLKLADQFGVSTKARVQRRLIVKPVEGHKYKTTFVGLLGASETLEELVKDGALTRGEAEAVNGELTREFTGDSEWTIKDSLDRWSKKLYAYGLYLKKPQERFARFFEQYVAYKSKGKQLTCAHTYEKYTKMSAWYTDAEFKAILSHFKDLVAKRFGKGFLKSLVYRIMAGVQRLLKATKLVRVAATAKRKAHVRVVTREKKVEEKLPSVPKKMETAMYWDMVDSYYSSSSMPRTAEGATLAMSGMEHGPSQEQSFALLLKWKRQGLVEVVGFEASDDKHEQVSSDWKKSPEKTPVRKRYQLLWQPTPEGWTKMLKDRKERQAKKVQMQKSRSGKSWSDHLVDYHREKYGDMTTRVRLVVRKAKPHGAASAQPPKGWWDETYARVKKENPKLPDERIRKIVGSMWYQQMGHPARKKVRGSEGKKYRKVAKSRLVLRKAKKTSSNKMKDELVGLFKKGKLTDDAFHAFAEKHGWEPDDLEEAAYGLLADLFGGGLAKKKGTTFADVDRKELAMGAKVEMEHTKSKRIARRIALDHLAEDSKYYTKLKKIEGA